MCRAGQPSHSLLVDFRDLFTLGASLIVRESVHIGATALGARVAFWAVGGVAPREVSVTTTFTTDARAVATVVLGWAGVCV